MKQSSKTITQNQNQTHVSLSLWVRYVPIPVSWSVVENPDAITDSPDERFVLMPEVDQSRNWKPSEPLDPFELRTQFLKLDIDSQVRTLDFLNSIGVWNINEHTGEDFMRINRAVGHRYVTGFAAPLTVSALKAAQKRVDTWLRQLKNPKALTDLFGPPPKSGKEVEQLAHASRNRWLNTFPLHLEWHRYAEGVVQPVTGHEMLSVTLQLDLMRNADPQVCTYCEHPFTDSRNRDYCSDSCMKAAAQKRYRDKNQSTKWRKTV